MKKIVKNVAGLVEVAQEILRLKPGIVAMEGPLGAGKTALVKAMAKVLDIEDDITSPTFVLHHQHRIRNQELGIMFVNHIDCWRMESGGELEQIGFEKMIDSKSIIVIEWAERVKDIISKYENRVKIVWVNIEYGEKGGERLVSWSEV